MPAAIRRNAAFGTLIYDNVPGACEMRATSRRRPPAKRVATAMAAPRSVPRATKETRAREKSRDLIGRISWPVCKSRGS